MNKRHGEPITSMGRRSVLKLAGAAAIAPMIWVKNTEAAQETVVIRSPGGAYDEIRRKLIYDPFTAKTGIRVIPVATTTGKLEAMIKSGHLELDIIDNDDSVLLQWEDALAPLNYAGFKFTDPADILPEYKHDKYVGNFVYADVMGYNLGKWKQDTVPKSWADFWDFKKYPSTRALADMDSGAPNLEFALLADGVPMDKLYPLDLPRAFKALSRIKPGITKFWSSGALSVQMLSTREADLSSVWSTRILNGIANNAPLEINWNQHGVHVQAYAVLKKAKNFENAQKLVDFCLSKEVQSKFSALWNSGPVTKAAYESLTPALRDKIPGGDRTRQHGFLLDAKWWADNRAVVGKEWAKWSLNS
ncbi:ABC transporter substrate-binding protein [Pandoraea pnomenusa]|uniref:ABC transporter substrate-binding protein n=1 Tax=Pandoraea pnomenusa TaxID=93220 RepID=UPI001AD2F387|nr:ABC transporter substrate-binding protein [Pandoraea pnomenusa]MBN9091749.1 ABC transporter substrate-binding protein [Pandoraea pnomenusa]